MDDVKIALEELKEESESGRLAAAEPRNVEAGPPLVRWMLVLRRLIAVGGGVGDLVDTSTSAM